MLTFFLVSAFLFKRPKNIIVDKTVYADEHSLVKIRPIPEVPDSDYINANYVEVIEKILWFKFLVTIICFVFRDFILTMNTLPAKLHFAIHLMTFTV